MSELNNNNAQSRINEAVATIEATPLNLGWHGRGIVFCAGGERYFVCAWVSIRHLRRLGCNLPIQVWHLGPGELNEKMQSLLAPLDVECVDAHVVRMEHPARRLFGWELKPYAILHSPFNEVLYMDADNVAIRDPNYLFETPEFKEHGTVFWPDYGRLDASRMIWSLTGIPFRDEPEVESGQILINKNRRSVPLRLSMWMNEHSDFWYQHIHGDKETFHMAWRKLDAPYAMPSRGIHGLAGTMCQHDFHGQRVFQHRNMAKWSFDRNDRVEGFENEKECLEYIEELRSQRREILGAPPWRPEAAEHLVGKTVTYHRVGYDTRTMLLSHDGTIDEGSAGMEQFWCVRECNGKNVIEIYGREGLTTRLRQDNSKAWLYRGHWESYERMPVELSVHRAQVIIDLMAWKTVKTISGAEIGVYRGETSRVLLRSLPQLTLLMIDWWSNPSPASDYSSSGDNFAFKPNTEYEAAMNEAISSTEFARDRRVIIRGEQRRAASFVGEVSFDFVFIDGDHSYSGTLSAIEAWWPKVKPGGMLCGHDYGRTERKFGVDRAVHEFAHAQRLSVHTGPDFMWVVWKRAQEDFGRSVCTTA